MKFTLFTDGACIGNPGPGGWAYVIRDESSRETTEAFGHEPDTTNNRMEMTAVIKGLEFCAHLGLTGTSIELVSDSQYVLKGMSEWLPGWKAKGWKRRDGGRYVDVKNRDLWEEMDKLIQKHNIVKYTHVKGHSGHIENERCDKLANAACVATEPVKSLAGDFLTAKTLDTKLNHIIIELALTSGIPELVSVTSVPARTAVSVVIKDRTTDSGPNEDDKLFNDEDLSRFMALDNWSDFHGYGEDANGSYALDIETLTNESNKPLHRWP